MNKEDIKNKFKIIKEIDDEFIFARNSEDEFFRILRKSCQYENANIKTFNDKKFYDGSTINNAEEIKNKLNYYRNNPIERFKPKNDQNGTNISDNIGLGSVRNSPPHESPEFDKQYFEFIDNLIQDDDIIVDVGGGFGLFDACLTNIKSKKLLVEKNGAYSIPEYNIEYIDADEFDWNKKYDYVFCHHTLEHLQNPELLIKNISNSVSKIAFFSTPLKELIVNSIHHYIYIELEILIKLLQSIGKHAYIHISKTNLDVHFMIVNDKDILKKIYKDKFFLDNWKDFKNF